MEDEHKGSGAWIYDRNVVKLAQTAPLWATHHFYTPNDRVAVGEVERFVEDEYRDGVEKKSVGHTRDGVEKKKR